MTTIQVGESFYKTGVKLSKLIVIKCHVIAEIEDQVVWKTYASGKDWRYQIESRFLFDLNYGRGRYRKNRFVIVTLKPPQTATQTVRTD